MKADGYMYINKYESKSYNQDSDQEDGVGGHRTTSSRTHQKYVHVKQLSLNTNQKLVERLSTTKTVRKIHMDLQEWKRSDQVRTHVSGRGLRRK